VGRPATAGTRSSWSIGCGRTCAEWTFGCRCGRGGGDQADHRRGASKVLVMTTFDLTSTRCPRCAAGRAVPLKDTRRTIWCPRCARWPVVTRCVSPSVTRASDRFLARAAATARRRDADVLTEREREVLVLIAHACPTPNRPASSSSPSHGEEPTSAGCCPNSPSGPVQAVVSGLRDRPLAPATCSHPTSEDQQIRVGQVVTDPTTLGLMDPTSAS